MGDVVRILPKGIYSLAELPQRESIEKSAISTGWWELDNLWRIYSGQFTVITGLAGSGKSTFALNVIANMSAQYARGMRTFMFVPENEQSMREKLRGIWGDRPGWEYFAHDQVLIQSATEEAFGDQPMDLYSVLERAVAVIEREGAEVLLIDPWNELEHLKPPDMLMTDYIRTALMYLKRICRHYRVAVILIAHPTKAVTEKGGRTPTLADIEGSMAWYNKCDNGLIVVREDKITKVISAKVREIGAGKIGVCHFQVDASTGRFTPQYGGVST